MPESMCSCGSENNGQLSLKCVPLAVMVMKFFFDHFDFTSSGAVAALVQGLLAKELWKRGIPRKLSSELPGIPSLLLTPCWLCESTLCQHSARHA